VAVLATASCDESGSPAVDQSYALDITPAEPSVGQETRATLSLRDKAGQPWRGATLQIEAHMTHPGMVPVVVPLRGGGDGTYAGALTFTMAGPWAIFVTGTLPDGRRLHTRIADQSVRLPE
jgi:hypothetical protein